MKKHKIWGIAILILLLGIAAVFIFLNENAELRKLEKETAESDKLREERNKPQEVETQIVDADKLPPSENAETRYVHEDSTVHPGNTKQPKSEQTKVPHSHQHEMKAKIAEIKKDIEERQLVVDQQHRQVYELGQERASLMSMIEKSIERRKRVQGIRDAEKAGKISLAEAMRLKKEIWESPEARAYAEFAESMEENQSEKD